MPIGELIHIAVQVLATHVVENTIVPALEQGPKTFYAVSMSLIADVFPNRVVDG